MVRKRAIAYRRSREMLMSHESRIVRCELGEAADGTGSLLTVPSDFREMEIKLDGSKQATSSEPSLLITGLINDSGLIDAGRAPALSARAISKDCMMPVLS